MHLPKSPWSDQRLPERRHRTINDFFPRKWVRSLPLLELLPTLRALADINSTARGWRWGYGMFCVLTPVLAIPIIVTLTLGMRETKAQLSARSMQPLNFSPNGIKRSVVNVFWKLDLVGLFLLVGGAGLFLVAITLANSRTARWYDGTSRSRLISRRFPLFSSNQFSHVFISTASSITMLVIGGCGVIGFVLWEKYAAKFPLIPFSLLRNRSVSRPVFSQTYIGAD